MLFRVSMTSLTVGAGVLAAIGGIALLSENQTTMGAVMIATALVVCGIGVATWRWLREPTGKTG